jgi:hypothetical protein
MGSEDEWTPRGEGAGTPSRAPWLCTCRAPRSVFLDDAEKHLRFFE